MTSQMPTRFENYPPEPGVGVPVDDGGASATGTSSHRAAALQRRNPPRPASSGVPRRTVAALMIGIPLAAVAGIVWWTDETDESAETAGSPIARTGRYATTVARGWTPLESREEGLALTKGANRLYAWALQLPPSTVAADELKLLTGSSLISIGYTGSTGEAVDASTADVQRASLAGSGLLGGRDVRLIANLWIDADGEALLALRILAAEPNSGEAYGAQRMIGELSRSFE